MSIVFYYLNSYNICYNDLKVFQLIFLHILLLFNCILSWYQCWYKILTTDGSMPSITILIHTLFEK